MKKIIYFIEFYAPALLRYGIGAVILWFSLAQFFNASLWIAYSPDGIVSMTGLSATTLVYFNAVFELIFGTFLIFGWQTRIVAFLLAVHLFAKQLGDSLALSQHMLLDRYSTACLGHVAPLPRFLGAVFVIGADAYVSLAAQQQLIDHRTDQHVFSFFLFSLQVAEARVQRMGVQGSLVDQRLDAAARE